MAQEFADLNCTTCNSPLEETGKVIRNANAPGPYILCTHCQTYYQMFYDNGSTAYIVPLYRDYNKILAEKKERDGGGKEVCDCSHVRNNHVHRGKSDIPKECCECTCREFETDKRTLKEKIAFSRTVDEFLSSIHQD